MVQDWGVHFIFAKLSLVTASINHKNDEDFIWDLCFSKISNILLLKRGTPQKVRAKYHNASVVGSVSKCLILPGIRGKIKQGVSIQKVCTDISKFDLWKYFQKFCTSCDEKISFGMFLLIQILHLGMFPMFSLPNFLVFLFRSIRNISVGVIHMGHNRSIQSLHL